MNGFDTSMSLIDALDRRYEREVLISWDISLMGVFTYYYLKKAIVNLIIAFNFEFFELISI